MALDRYQVTFQKLKKQINKYIAKEGRENNQPKHQKNIVPLL
jgi:hypothetical protein